MEGKSGWVDECWQEDSTQASSLVLAAPQRLGALSLSDPQMLQGARVSMHYWPASFFRVWMSVKIDHRGQNRYKKLITWIICEAIDLITRTLYIWLQEEPKHQIKGRSLLLAVRSFLRTVCFYFRWFCFGLVYLWLKFCLVFFAYGWKLVLHFFLVGPTPPPRTRQELPFWNCGEYIFGGFLPTCHSGMGRHKSLV